VATYLIDTSAWHRRANPAVAQRWAELLTADEVSITEPIRVEVLYSARSSDEYEELSEELDGLHQARCGNAEMQRALDVQRLLAHQGVLHHRSVRIPDLLIAATAERAGLVVLHYDEDYDRVAALTGQGAEWIVPRGSVS
jgi:predicted nucleic acid-binding protein